MFLLGMEKDKRKLTEDDATKLKWEQINTALRNDQNVSKPNIKVLTYILLIVIVL